MHFDDHPAAKPSHDRTGVSVVARGLAVPVVRLRRGLAGLALRHDGPAALQPGSQAGRHPADRCRARRSGDGRQGRRIQRLRHVDLHDRLGARGHLLRHPRRQDRPRQDHDDHRPLLLGVHGLECALEGRLGLRRLPLPHRAGRGRPVRGGRGPGGRGDVGSRPALRAGVAPGPLGAGQHDGGPVRHRAGAARRDRSDRQRLACHVPDRTGPCPARHPDLPQAEGARAVEGRGQGEGRELATDPVQPTSWARWPRCSAIRGGEGTRSSA